MSPSPSGTNDWCGFFPSSPPAVTVVVKNNWSGFPSPTAVSNDPWAPTPSPSERLSYKSSEQERFSQENGWNNGVIGGSLGTMSMSELICPHGHLTDIIVGCSIRWLIGFTEHTHYDSGYKNSEHYKPPHFGTRVFVAGSWS